MDRTLFPSLLTGGEGKLCRHRGAVIRRAIHCSTGVSHQQEAGRKGLYIVPEAQAVGPGAPSAAIDTGPT